MDPEDFPAFLDKIHTTKTSRIQLWQLYHAKGISQSSGQSDLDDETILTELHRVHTLFKRQPAGASCMVASGPFVLFLATGDATNKSEPLQISKLALTKIMESCRLPPQMLMACALDRFHLSHLVQYGDNNEGPIGLVVLLRIPRNSQYISVAMHIRLVDHATSVVITARKEESGQAILKKCGQRIHLLRTHPLYLLVMIYEMRVNDFKQWFDEIRHEIDVVSSATGMTRRSWRMRLSPKIQEWFLNYDNLLRKMHATHTELSHFGTVAVFSVKFGRYLLESVTRLEQLQADAGVKLALPARNLAQVRERIVFTLFGCEFDADKTKELLERV